MGKLSIGELLKRTREKRGMSLYSLAETTGVDRGVLWRIESGEVAEPKPETLSKLAHALGMSVSQLYRSTGYQVDPLPEFKGYLRSKYGHLPPDQRQALVTFFEDIEAEYGNKRRNSGTTKRREGP